MTVMIAGINNADRQFFFLLKDWWGNYWQNLKYYRGFGVNNVEGGCMKVKLD